MGVNLRTCEVGRSYQLRYMISWFGSSFRSGKLDLTFLSTSHYHKDYEQCDVDLENTLETYKIIPLAISLLLWIQAAQTWTWICCPGIRGAPLEIEEDRNMQVATDAMTMCTTKGEPSLEVPRRPRDRSSQRLPWCSHRCSRSSDFVGQVTEDRLLQVRQPM